MAEPLMWQILLAFQAALDEIEEDDGVTYHYTPDSVLIVPHWDDARLWDTSLAIQYAVRRDGDRIHREGDTGDSTGGGWLRAAVDVHVLVTQKYSPSSPADVPSIVLMAERMQKDVLRKMFLDHVTLGGLVNNIAEPEASDEYWEEDRDGGTWVAAELTFRVDYNWQAAAP